MERSRPGVTRPGSREHGNGAPEPHEADPAKLACFLHQAGKLARLYVDPEICANPAWDIMLTLYLGEHDDVPVSRASLAAGNRLGDSECDAVLDRLEAAGLVTRPGAAAGQPQQIRLSKDGRQRMQAFLRSIARE